MAPRSKAPAPAAPPSPELIRDALQAIPPDLAREDWVRAGMAIHSELGEAGFEIWDSWSQQGDGYSAAGARTTWRTFKAGGDVKIATLFHIAKGHGWKSPKIARPKTVEERRAAEEAAALAVEDKRRRADAEAAELQRRHEAAAARCLDTWEKASEAPPKGGSPYLRRKGVEAHGLRFRGGVAVVPMRDIEGRLWSLQRLLPKRLRDKTGAETTDKLYGPLKEGPDDDVASRKTQLMHVIGTVDGAPLVLLAEGYATSATLHEATGRPVIVCFDSGNLVHVARVVRERWPALPLLVCGDDDRATEARGRGNAGRKMAEQAAKLAGSAAGLALDIFPQGLPEGGSDFNDLAALSGLDAVRSQVGAAVDALLASAAQAVQAGAGEAIGGAGEAQAVPEAAGAPGGPVLRLVPGGKAARRVAAAAGGGGGGTGAGGGGQEADEPGGGGGDGGDGDTSPGGAFFTIDERGVWHQAPDRRPQWVCSPLRVIARTRSEDSRGWGKLLSFTDFDGNPKTWVLPRSMHVGDGVEWAQALTDMGLDLAQGTSARNLLAQYINTRRPLASVTCSDRVGWHDGSVYLLPSGCIVPTEQDDEDRQYVFQSEHGLEDTFRRRGTLAEWRDSVGKLAEGNSRIVFALCCALAGAVVRPAGIESGGFHLRGDSSVGKTTALKVAASVWGSPSYLQRWRATDNALEAIATQHSDACLVLDELGQLDPKVAGECAYMLANEQEKGRATRGAMLRKRRTWRLLFLSSGEVSLADHMAEAGKRTRAGMEVRMLDVPLDAGAGMGGIERLNGHERPGELADAIVQAGARVYGVAGRAWLQWLCDNHAGLSARLADAIERHRDALVPESAAEQVRRAGTRFALVAAAGELATKAGITGWPEGEAFAAVRSCFNAWLGARGHAGNSESLSMVRQVRQFLELHGEARFAPWDRAGDDRAPKTLLRAGFRREIGADGNPISRGGTLMGLGDRSALRDESGVKVEYIVFREVFEREVCRGFDPQAVARLLKRLGHLQGEGDRLLDRQRLPLMGGDKVPCYRLKPSIFSETGDAL